LITGFFLVRFSEKLAQIREHESFSHRSAVTHKCRYCRKVSPIANM
jgi:hypothetical protein